jgi:hypothetical protein
MANKPAIRCKLESSVEGMAGHHKGLVPSSGCIDP